MALGQNFQHWKPVSGLMQIPAPVLFTDYAHELPVFGTFHPRYTPRNSLPNASCALVGHALDQPLVAHRFIHRLQSIAAVFKDDLASQLFNF
jgi:hypothetical protein